MAKKQYQFGYYPPETPNKYIAALKTLRACLFNIPTSSNSIIADQISIVKGMFNRILRHDRSDWATVNESFGFPDPQEIKKIVQLLPGLRKAYLNEDQNKIKHYIVLLKRTKLYEYIRCYLKSQLKHAHQSDSSTTKESETVHIDKVGTSPKLPSVAQSSANATNNHVFTSASSIVIWIYKAKYPCRQHPKMIESITANVCSIRDLEPHIMNISFCRQCRKYYINATSLELYVKKYGIPAVNIAISSDTDQQIDYGSWNDESILHYVGYNVNAVTNLSASERQQILRECLDAGIVTKPYVISFLEGLIRRNQKRESHKHAVSKWKSDLQFVHDYRINRQRKVSGVLRHENLVK